MGIGSSSFVLLSPRGVTDVHVYTPDRVEARAHAGFAHPAQHELIDGAEALLRRW